MSLRFKVRGRPALLEQPRLSDDFMTIVACATLDPPGLGELRALESRLGQDLGPLRSVAFEQREETWQRASTWSAWALELVDALEARAAGLSGIAPHYADGFPDASAVEAFATELRGLAEWLGAQDVEEFCFSAISS